MIPTERPGRAGVAVSETCCSDAVAFGHELGDVVIDTGPHFASAESRLDGPLGCRVGAQVALPFFLCFGDESYTVQCQSEVESCGGV